MKPRPLIVVVLVLLGWVVPACTDGAGKPADAGSGSGIASSKLVRDLTDAELGALCDWSAETTGGYGRVTMCDGGVTRRGEVSHDACVASVGRTPSCTAKVMDVEDCARLQAQDLCAFVESLQSAACMALFTCD